MTSYKDLKVSDQQANTKLTQLGRCDKRFQVQGPLKGNYILLAFHLTQSWQICQNKVQDEKYDFVCHTCISASIFFIVKVYTFLKTDASSREKERIYISLTKRYNLEASFQKSYFKENC